MYYSPYNFADLCERKDLLMIESLLLVIAVSADGFAAAIGLGSAGIKVPFKSSFVIAAIGTVSLLVSVLFADILQNIIPEGICTWLSFSLLMILGLYNLFQKKIRKLLRRKSEKNNLAIKIFLDETEADKDKSKTLSPAEAVALSVALSADSVVTGISAGLVTVNVCVLVTTSFCLGIASIVFGSKIGRKLAEKTSIELGWLCGIILIVLAVLGILH